MERNDRAGQEHISLELISAKLDKIKTTSRAERITLAFVPIVIAALTIFASFRVSESQLIHAQKLESARIISDAAELILRGGEAAELAEIALESVPLEPKRRDRVIAIIERKKAVPNDDGPLFTGGTKPSASALAAQLPSILKNLFANEKEKREHAYPQMRQYVETNLDDKSVNMIFDYIADNPYEVQGRSNVLSILASTSPSKLAPHADRIVEGLAHILSLESQSVSFAVGPKTKGWVAEIQRLLQT